MQQPPAIRGSIPVMVTPFVPEGGIDHEGLRKLVDWYLSNGSSALFAVCQSSEMQCLNIAERVDLVSSVQAAADRAVPVLASGHVSDDPEEQIDELVAVASTGIDVLVLVSNRLDLDGGGFSSFSKSLDKLLRALPENLPLGLYECPAPFRRLLGDDELRLVRDTGRFVFLKDVSCNLETVRRRLAIFEGTSLALVNANAAIAHPAMVAGSTGFAGVFTNFFPDLYAWLYRNRALKDPIVLELANFLALAANAEAMGYPVLAKKLHQRLGLYRHVGSRAIPYDIEQRNWALGPILDHLQEGGDRFREKIRSFDAHRAA